jgi:comEA protein
MANMIENFDEIIYKYRYVIGATLVVIILLGLGVLGFNYYQKNNAAKEDASVATLKQQNDQLRQELAQGATKQIVSSSAQTAVQNQGDKININTASVEDLDKIPDVGPARAKLIIDYRSQNGGFKTIEEMKNIKGIGDKTFEKMKDSITIGE